MEDKGSQAEGIMEELSHWVIFTWFILVIESFIELIH